MEIVPPGKCLKMVGVLVSAAQTQHTRWLKEYLLPTVLQSGKFKVKAPEDPLLNEGPLPALPTAASLTASHGIVTLQFLATSTLIPFMRAPLSRPHLLFYFLIFWSLLLGKLNSLV